MSNSAKQIETLIQATVSRELARQSNAQQKPADPLQSKDAVAGSIVRVKEKLQPGQKPEVEGEGITSPLTQHGALQLYDPVVQTDSSGIITLVYRPVAAIDFKTADAVPKDVRMVFTDVPRAP